MRYLIIFFFSVTYGITQDYTQLIKYKNEMKNKVQVRSLDTQFKQKHWLSNMYQIRYRCNKVLDLNKYSLKLEKVIADKIYIYRYIGEGSLDLKSLKKENRIFSIKKYKRQSFQPF